jgi:L-fuculose-phosphate aldolase
LKDYMELRKEVCKYAIKAYEKEWVTGSSGNVSARVLDEGDRYVITPTSVSYEELTPEQVVVIDGEGDLVLDLDYGPSVEWPMHLAVYKSRADVNAVMHTHATYCSILAVIRKSIPAIIEELVPYVGGEIVCAEYATTGSDSLAENAVKALGDKSAILIANHGNLCTGKNLLKAFNMCALVEKAAHIYVEVLKMGKFHLLPDEVVETELGMYEITKEM